jgi:hypothetical protein
MNDKSKIIDRIQKLLALAQSDNVNEASAAAAAAQKLMTTHDIEQAALDVDTGADVDVVVGSEVLHALGSKVCSWKGILAHALAEANGAKTYWHKAYEGPTLVASLKIIGTKDQSNTVRYLFAYLVNEVERLAREAPGKRTGSTRSWYASFRLGAASEIADRVQKAARQAVQEVKQEAAASNGASLVRVNDALARIDARTAAIRAHAKTLHLRSGRSSRVSDHNGYVAGKAAGATVRLGGGPSLGAGAKGAIGGGR